MKTISDLNLTFCEGADEMRYVVPKSNSKGFFFSNDVIPEPTEGSWLRSIKYKDENAFLFVLDIDTKKFDRNVLIAARGLYDTIKNYLHKKPVQSVIALLVFVGQAFFQLQQSVSVAHHKSCI